MSQKYIAWYSCGAPSATAAKLAIDSFGKENVRVIYQDAGSEHKDNKRFLLECQDWFGVDIEITKSEKYSDTWQVFRERRYLNGVGGAICTGELKRIPAEKCINWGKDQEIEIMGYTVEESDRVQRFIEQNNERRIYSILVERGLTKSDCLGFVDRAGIEIPEMYKLGYRNNNCIGCVKGGAGYWNKIKIDFPETFSRMAKQEREINAAINKTYESISFAECLSEIGAEKYDELIKSKNKSIVVFGDSYKTYKNPERVKVRRRVFLDQLPKKMGNYKKEDSIQCGVVCVSEYEGMEGENIDE